MNDLFLSDEQELKQQITRLQGYRSVHLKVKVTSQCTSDWHVNGNVSAGTGIFSQRSSTTFG